ncbi:hypothetical protein [Aeromonas jandaei]|uniref:hypothetical protein n=1 Tax=Aeromonas jandaei TaxID=650 RepID=UPI0038B5B4A1
MPQGMVKGSRVGPGGRIVGQPRQRQPGSCFQSAKAVQYVKQNDAKMLMIVTFIFAKQPVCGHSKPSLCIKLLLCGGYIKQGDVVMRAGVAVRA